MEKEEFKVMLSEIGKTSLLLINKSEHDPKYREVYERAVKINQIAHNLYTYLEKN